MKRVIEALLIASVVLLPLTVGAAQLFSTGFETTDDASYVLDSALPTPGSPLSDGAQWGIGYEDLGGVVPTIEVEVTIKAPESTATEWGSQCLDYVKKQTTSTAVWILEPNTMVAGYSECSFQYDIRFISNSEKVYVRLNSYSDYTNDAVSMMVWDGAVNRVKLEAWSANDITSTDTDYQVLITYKDGADPECTLTLTADPYGTTPSVIYTESAPARVDIAKAFNIAGKGTNPGCHFQVDNIIVSDSIDTDVANWRLY